MWTNRKALVLHALYPHTDPKNGADAATINLMRVAFERELDRLDNSLHHLAVANSDLNAKRTMIAMAEAAWRHMQRMSRHAASLHVERFDFAIVCDESNNPPSVRNDGEYRLHIKINDQLLEFEYLSMLDEAMQVARRILGDVRLLREQSGIKIICDHTNNTPEDIAQNRLNITLEGNEPWFLDYLQRQRELESLASSTPPVKESASE